MRLPELERYYDAVPRSAARVEEIGPFSLFVGTGPWPYCARPRLGGGCEIVGVATLPAVRRQGLGGAVTGALVEDAFARGVSTIFLSAGCEAIARVSARLGFRRVGTACSVG